VTYRIAELHVPKDDPFRNDALERKAVVEFLAGLVARTGGPFVLALDSPWGSGKTTLVRMLQSELERNDFQCIYFNAWRVDHAVDPLVALVSSVDRMQLAAGASQAKFDHHVKTIRKVTSLVAKRGAVALAKALTVGALDLDKEIEDATAELSGGTVEDIVTAFRKEDELLEKFRAELRAAVALLPEAGKKSTLVWFIDELDRCRPTFAIQLLERIKHLFDVENVVFVLSLDKRQLEASTAAIYGSDIDAAEYLRRFIDLEYGIPLASTKRFTDSLLTRSDLERVFAERKGEVAHDREHFVEFFTAIADLFGLSLRARERCITRLRVVMDQTPSNQYLQPILVALLLVLRSNAPDSFWGFVRGEKSPEDVMALLRGFPRARELLKDQVGLILEAFLIASDPDRERAEARSERLRAFAADEHLDEEERERARELNEMRRHVGRMRGRGLNLRTIASKIDMAASIRE
jgi:hypothetical protein